MNKEAKRTERLNQNLSVDKSVIRRRDTRMQTPFESIQMTAKNKTKNQEIRFNQSPSKEDRCKERLTSPGVERR